MEVLYYYDGPQLWLDFLDGEQRLFVNYEGVDNCKFDVVSGVISIKKMNMLRNNEIKLNDCWHKITNFKTHTYNKDGELDFGKHLDALKAWALEPFGDAYLNA